LLLLARWRQLARALDFHHYVATAAAVQNNLPVLAALQKLRKLDDQFCDYGIRAYVQGYRSYESGSQQV
jgi:hypothetical protein